MSPGDRSALPTIEPFTNETPIAIVHALLTPFDYEPSTLPSLEIDKGAGPRAQGPQQGRRGNTTFPKQGLFVDTSLLTLGPALPEVRNRRRAQSRRGCITQCRHNLAGAKATDVDFCCKAVFVYVGPGWCDDLLR